MEMRTLWNFFYSKSQHDKHIEETPKSEVEYELKKLQKHIENIQKNIRTKSSDEEIKNTTEYTQFQ